MLELVASFLLGFIATWFLSRGGKDILTKPDVCPKQEAFVKIAEHHGHHKKISRELKEYSLEMIKDGHFEYGDVLQTLMKKEKNDKS